MGSSRRASKRGASVAEFALLGPLVFGGALVVIDMATLPLRLLRLADLAQRAAAHVAASASPESELEDWWSRHGSALAAAELSLVPVGRAPASGHRPAQDIYFVRVRVTERRPFLLFLPLPRGLNRPLGTEGWDLRTVVHEGAL